MKKMGACESVDEIKNNNDIYIPRKSNLPVTAEELERNQSMENFMSKHRMSVFCNTDPINRSSLFSTIVSEFKEEFDRDIDKNELYKYFGCR